MQPASINFAGVITDRQSFLDTAREWTIEGDDQPPTGRRLLLSVRWTAASDRAEEGDLTLVDPPAGELYATLTSGTVVEVTDQDGEVAAAQLDLTFEVTGGDGSFAGVTGSVTLTGTIAGDGEGSGGSFEGGGALLTLRLSLEGGQLDRSPSDAPLTLGDR